MAPTERYDRVAITRVSYWGCPEFKLRSEGPIVVTEDFRSFSLFILTNTRIVA
jgi:hypothetical protein